MSNAIIKKAPFLEPSFLKPSIYLHLPGVVYTDRKFFYYFGMCKFQGKGYLKKKGIIFLTGEGTVCFAAIFYLDTKTDPTIIRKPEQASRVTFPT